MEKFIIYGAGCKGKAYYELLKSINLDESVLGFCDKRYEDINDVCGKPVYSYEEAKKKQCLFIIGVRKEYELEIINAIKQDGLKYYEQLDSLLVDEMHLMNRVEYERTFCAVSHVDTMDQYFSDAERPDVIEVFWGEGPFRQMFDRLDLSNVVELACGRGRHTEQYVDEAGIVTLVDVLEKNIDYCKDRFKNCNNVKFVVNNGHDLSSLSDEQYTALFTYDSMVHFELMDVANYLNESYRILAHGGMALFHHSNNYQDYKASYASGVHSRSFMSDKIFAHLAYRSGFEVLEQKVIDWGIPNLDCLTLVRKR